MDWSLVLTALGLILSILIAGVAFVRGLMALVKAYGEDRGEFKAWRQRVDDALKGYTTHTQNRLESLAWKQGVEDTLKRHGDHHKDHYAHANNEDSHWTKRERDDVVARLDRIEELVKDSMKQRSRKLQQELLD